MKRHMHIFMGVFGTVVALFGAIFSCFAQALNYQTEVEVEFTLLPEITISISGEGTTADLLIDSLAPDTSANSNTITVALSTNAAYGYNLSATVGSVANATRNLCRTGSELCVDKFESIDSYTDSLSSDNTWGYSIDGGNHYNGLPLHTDMGVTLETTNDSVEFLIGAKAGANQAVGTYTNVINFSVVAKSVWDEDEFSPM